MNYIAQKVDDGLLDLTKVSTATLMQWSDEATSREDMDALGHEIMYRGKNEV